MADAFARRVPRYDQSGEEHYNLLSAYHKSLRGSDPQGARSRSRGWRTRSPGGSPPTTSPAKSTTTCSRRITSRSGAAIRRGRDPARGDGGRVRPAGPPLRPVRRRALQPALGVSQVAPGQRSAGGAIPLEVMADAFARRVPPYDQSGEEHYNLLSAYHKSLRGSDPQGARSRSR